MQAIQNMIFYLDLWISHNYDYIVLFHSPSAIVCVRVLVCVSPPTGYETLKYILKHLYVH